VKNLQSRAWLLVAVIAMLLFAGVLANPRLNYESVPLEQLINAIENGEVNEVIVRNQTEVTAIYGDGTQVRSTKPAEMQLLAELNLSDNLGRALQYREENNPTGAVLRAGALIVLPLVALTALYIFYISRVNAARVESAK
jgi:ATP-dependent Zn protease